MSSPLMLYPRSRSTPPILYPILYPRSLPTISSGFSTHGQFSVPTHNQFWFLYPRSVLSSTHPQSVPASLPTVSSQYPPTISSGFSTHGQLSVPTDNQFRFLYPWSVLSSPTVFMKVKVST